MKTTIEINDALLDEAKRAARDSGETLRELVEQALRTALAQRKRAARKKFKLRDASFEGRGEGLQPPFDAEMIGGRADRLGTTKPDAYPAVAQIRNRFGK